MNHHGPDDSKERCCRGRTHTGHPSIEGCPGSFCQAFAHRRDGLGTLLNGGAAWDLRHLR